MMESYHTRSDAGESTREDVATSPLGADGATAHVTPGHTQLNVVSSEQPLFGIGTTEGREMAQDVMREAVAKGVTSAKRLLVPAWPISPTRDNQMSAGASGDDRPDEQPQQSTHDSGASDCWEASATSWTFGQSGDSGDSEIS